MSFEIVNLSNVLNFKNKLKHINLDKFLLRNYTSYARKFVLNLILSLLYFPFQMYIYWTVSDVHPSHRDDKPLSKEHRMCLDVNRHPLCRCIHIDEEFCSMIVQNGCVTQEHMEYIKCAATTVDTIERFLDILRRRSLTSYNVFLDILHFGQHSRELADSLKSFTG